MGYEDGIIYIPNITGDVLSFVQSLPQEARQFEIDENIGLTYRAALAYPGHSHLSLISPIKIDTRFIEYTERLLNREVTVFVPRAHSGELAKDVLNDKKLLTSIRHLATTTRLAAYSPTPELYALIDALRKQHSLRGVVDLPDHYIPQAFEEIGGKIGIRELLDQHTDRSDVLHMASGFVCKTRQEMMARAIKAYAQWGGVVIKTRKGHAGAGVEIFRPGMSAVDFQAELESRLTQSYWDVFPSVVEQFVDVDHKIAGGFPNAEFLIDEFGEVSLQYYCGMSVNENGMFMGVEISQDIFGAKIKKPLHATGMLIGNYLQQVGYRGKFEVDCIAGKDGTVYVTEVNVRQNGGSEVFDVARHLLGSNLNSHVVLSNNNALIREDTPIRDFASVQTKLGRMLIQSPMDEGVIITGTGLLKARGTVGYMVIANDRSTAIQIQTEMFKVLRQ